MEEQDLIKQNAKEDYLNGVKNKEIASKYEISENTLKSWIRRGKWKTEKEALKEGAHKEEKGAPHKSKGAPLKEQEKPKNAQSGGGNPEPQNQFPKRNQAARKHGLYAKYLTQKQTEIIEDFEEFDIAAKLLIQIEMKFSAIVQLQSVMGVNGPDDHIEFGTGDARRASFAHERYESYIKAYTRASAEYRNLVKSFNEYAHADDERRLRVEKMQAEITKLNAEAAIAKNKADKLTASGASNALLQALFDVKSGGDGTGSATGGD